MPHRRDPARSRPRSARAASWLAWAAASFVMWLLLTSTVRGSEMVVGAAVSTISATVADAVRRRAPIVFRPRLRWLRRAAGIPWRVVTETGLLLGVLARHVTGRERAQGAFLVAPFPSGAEDDPEAAARRALATVGLSVSPNSYVVGVDQKRGEMLVHQIVVDPERFERKLRGRGAR
jgi:multisubunit Na+/H+ antiporter MnhE subunit